MASGNRDLLTRYSDDQPTDIEVALYMVQLLDDLAGDLCRKGQTDVLEYYLTTAMNASQTMKNSMARALVKDKVGELRRAKPIV